MEQLIPFAYASLGSILDNLSTRQAVKRFGIKAERNEIVRELMQKYGVKEGLQQSEWLIQTILLGGGLGLYFIDKFFGVENETWNLHKGWLYGMGTLSYLAATWNFLGCGLYDILNKKPENKLNKLNKKSLEKTVEN